MRVRAIYLCAKYVVAPPFYYFFGKKEVNKWFTHDKIKIIAFLVLSSLIIGCLSDYAIIRDPEPEQVTEIITVSAPKKPPRTQPKEVKPKIWYKETNQDGDYGLLFFFYDPNNKINFYGAVYSKKNEIWLFKTGLIKEIKIREIQNYKKTGYNRLETEIDGSTIYWIDERNKVKAKVYPKNREIKELKRIMIEKELLDKSSEYSSRFFAPK